MGETARQPMCSSIGESTESPGRIADGLGGHDEWSAVVGRAKKQRPSHCIMLGFAASTCKDSCGAFDEVHSLE